MVLSSLLGRPVKGALLWTTSGISAGWLLPPLLSQAGIIYSTTLISTTMFGGALAILLPIGIARGVVSSAQYVLIAEEEKVIYGIQQVMKQFEGRSDSSSKSGVLISEVSNNNTNLFLETMTQGSGMRGRLFRFLVSPFLPSTAQMLVRVQQTIDDANKVSSSSSLSTSTSSSSSSSVNSDIVAAGTIGFLEGFLQDKNDTITMLGGFAYLTILGGGFGLDYSYRKANEKRIELKQKASKKQNVWKAQLVERLFGWTTKSYDNEEEEEGNIDDKEEVKDSNDDKKNEN